MPGLRAPSAAGLRGANHLGCPYSPLGTLATGPPAANDTFFGILLGNSFDAGTPADASISYEKLTTINGVYRNVQTLTQNLTLAASDNALVAGPFTVQSGSTLTVPSGATFVIV